MDIEDMQNAGSFAGQVAKRKVADRIIEIKTYQNIMRKSWQML